MIYQSYRFSMKVKLMRLWCVYIENEKMKMILKIV
jgi:hypothetical protein